MTHDPAYPRFIPALGLKLECVPGCPDCAALVMPAVDDGPPTDRLF